MPRRHNGWLVWMVATVGSFAVLETRALTTRNTETLSGALARWSGTYPRKRHGSVVPLIFVGFWIWLTVHVVTWKGEK